MVLLQIACKETPGILLKKIPLHQRIQLLGRTGTSSRCSRSYGSRRCPGETGPRKADASSHLIFDLERLKAQSASGARSMSIPAALPRGRVIQDVRRRLHGDFPLPEVATELRREAARMKTKSKKFSFFLNQPVNWEKSSPGAGDRFKSKWLLEQATATLGRRFLAS